MRTALRFIRAGLIGYLVVLLLLMIFEESLIFFPVRYPDGDWSLAGQSFEDAEFVADDGTRLHGCYLPHAQARAHVLFAHGNAGNLTHRSEVMRILRDKLRVSVLIFDYRGYGKSGGRPHEAGILQDARAARAWLARRAGIGESDVVLMGRSLGAAVAIDLAAGEGARGLILESAFTSLPDVAAVHYPWAPVRLLMRNRLNSQAKISAYHGPLLQSHGDADEIVPFTLGLTLFETAPKGAKQFITLPNVYHNDPQPFWYYEELDTFLQGLD